MSFSASAISRRLARLSRVRYYSVSAAAWAPRGNRNRATYADAPTDVKYKEWSPPEVISNPLSLRVGLFGRPNAGKSHLLNRLVETKVREDAKRSGRLVLCIHSSIVVHSRHLLSQQIAAESPKSHTTRDLATGVYTEGRVQLVVDDTPGYLSDRCGHA